MQKIINAIKNSKNVALFAHINPDIDAISSLYLTKKILEKLGKNVKVFLEKDIPNKLKNFPDFSFQTDISNKIEHFKDTTYQTDLDNKNFDLLISVDTPSPKLLGKFEEYFLNFNNTISFDHHAERTSFAKLDCVENISANSIIMYELAKGLGIELDKEMLTATYAGIVGDTDRFLNRNTDLKTFETANELIKNGADIQRVNDFLYRKQSLKEVKFLGEVYNNIEIYNNILITIIKNSDPEIANYNIANQLQNMENIEAVIVITEISKNLCNISFRSQGKINVSEIAKKFGGGGHKFASGAKKVNMSASAIKKIIIEVEKEI